MTLDALKVNCWITISFFPRHGDWEVVADYWWYGAGLGFWSCFNEKLSIEVGKRAGFCNDVGAWRQFWPTAKTGRSMDDKSPCRRPPPPLLPPLPLLCHYCYPLYLSSDHVLLISCESAEVDCHCARIICIALWQMSNLKRRQLDDW